MIINLNKNHFLQVNFDLEGGQSGSAVFNEKGKCVGIAFQSAGRGKPSEVIPVSIIKHFIQDYEKNGRYTGTSQVHQFCFIILLYVKTLS